jgi:3-oxoacyl-[acyl-carrier protein] reductase
MANNDLSGTTCIVTGGGRGLGRSMVHALAAAGANVTAAMHIADDIEGETKELPGTVKAIVADIRDPAQCSEIVSGTVTEFGGIDMLVNNAGVGMLLVSDTFNRTPTKFWDVETDIWTQIVETNVNGGFQMARESVPHMLDRGWGRVVNVTTSIHTMQRAGFSPYGPTKAMMEANTSCWSEDLEGTGVSCNILIPGGAADTNLLPGNPGDPGRSGADGMLVSPEVMQAPILWLASRNSDGWNGKRFIGRLWDDSLSAEDAAIRCSAPAGFNDRT